MPWFARASVALVGFLGKILVAVKKLFSSTIFSDFRYSIPVPGLCIFKNPCQVSKMVLKKLEIVDNRPQSTHIIICSVHCNVKNK